MEDYAFLIRGLIDLYEATFDERWLEWALRLQESQDRLFWDSEDGGYFSSAADDPSILIRMKDGKSLTTLFCLLTSVVAVFFNNAMASSKSALFRRKLLDPVELVY